MSHYWPPGAVTQYAIRNRQYADRWRLPTPPYTDAHLPNRTPTRYAIMSARERTGASAYGTPSTSRTLPLCM